MDETKSQFSKKINKIDNPLVTTDKENRRRK